MEATLQAFCCEMLQVKSFQSVCILDKSTTVLVHSLFAMPPILKDIHSTLANMQGGLRGQIRCIAAVVYLQHIIVLSSVHVVMVLQFKYGVSFELVRPLLDDVCPRVQASL